MNSKQFKYALVLANEGSFSKAANILNISQPSLSQYIKKIEQQIGLELFERTNGEVRLTDAGRVYIETGRKILDLQHQMEVQFSDIASHKKGTLIIGASPYRTTVMMPEIVKRFQKIYPGMQLVIREATTIELLDGMEHGEYDLCMTMLPIDQRLYRHEKVVEEELVLAVPASYDNFAVKSVSGRKYPAVDASQLNGHRFVMLTDTQYMQKQLENLVIDCDLSLQTATTVKSLEAQIAMVRAGAGMALVPTGIEKFCSKEEVKFYSFEQDLPKREVVVMWRKDRELSEVAKELKDVICGIDW